MINKRIYAYDDFYSEFYVNFIYFLYTGIWYY